MLWEEKQVNLLHEDITSNFIKIHSTEPSGLLSTYTYP